MDAHDSNVAKFGFELKNLDSELRVVSLKGSEGMSRLFQFELGLASEDPDIDFSKVVNQPAAITIDGQDDRRHVHGIVRRFEVGEQGSRFTHYHALVVPKLWWLGNRRDCRIFQEKTIQEIIEQVFKEAGLTKDDYRFSLQEKYPKRDYCVQYRESDLAFVERLMEDEGVFYYFEHDDQKHTLVIGDNSSSYQVIPGSDSLPFHRPTGAMADEEHIVRFRYTEGVSPGKVVLRDYNFRKPGADLEVQGDADTYSDLTVYDYPGEYEEPDQGKIVKNIRQQELVCGRKNANGTTACARMIPGHQFALCKHPRESLNQKYLITHVEHDGMEKQALEEEATGNGSRYSADFECIPIDVVYRPRRGTPKPHMEGPQTAVVVGPKGEEIYTDEFGRVKVQFYWDRLGKLDENSSCWVRVSQLMAGGGWGAMFIPRIGQEVIVDFLEGDPDRPIITGRLYHGVNRPPYKLPDGKTKSTLKTTTTPDGGGSNEIRFDDNKGKEQIFLHGERNLDIRVKANMFETIGTNTHLKVAKDRFEHIEHDRHTTVDNDVFEKTGNDRHLKITGKHAVEVGASCSMTVKGDVIEVFKSNHSEQTTNNYYLKAMGIVIESMTGITFKCGGNNIVVDPSGVTIKGTSLTLDGTMVRVASGPGSPAGSGSAKQAVAPTDPEKAKEADTAQAGKAKSGGEEPDDNEKPFKQDESKKSWIEIELVDEDDKPIPGEKYKITMPDGSAKTGTLDENGFARVEGIDPGTCNVTFPNLDKDAWEKA